MKFLQLDPNDHQLFGLISPKEKILKELNDPKRFVIMYMSQGETFWLRYLVTLRYYYYRHVFLQDAKTYSDKCEFNVIKAIEVSFMSFSQMFTESKSDPFVLYSNLMNFVELVVQFDISDYSPDAIRAMMSEHKALKAICKYSHTVCRFWDRNMLIVVKCYMHFYASIINLMRRYDAAEDIDEKCDNSAKQYWRPFQIWNHESFVPSYFDKFIASTWGDDNLMEMLSIKPSTIKTFKSYKARHFCSVFLKNEKKFEVCHFVDMVPYSYPRNCCIHKNCWERISHDIDCEDPHFCFECPILCDTVISQKLKKISKNPSTFWRKLQYQCFEGFKEGYADASVQTECIYSHVNTYSLGYASEESLEPPPFLQCSQMKNSFYHFKRIVDVKIRLRNKLIKKKGDKYIIDFANVLYRRAVRQFSKDMKSQKFQNYTKDYDALIERLPFLNQCMETLVPFSENQCDSNKKTRSVGSGYDEMSFVTTVFKRKYEDSHSPDVDVTRFNKGVTSYISCSSAKDLSEKCVTNNGKPSNKEMSVKESNTNAGMMSKTKRKSETRTLVKNNEDPDEKFALHVTSVITSKGAQSSLEFISIHAEKTLVFQNNTNKPIEIKVTAKPAKKSAVTSKDSSTITTETNKNAQEFGGENLRKLSVAETISPDKEKPLCEHLNRSPQKLCAFCGMIEVKKKSFKMCGLCKIHKFEPPHYYCTRECQEADWEESHREKHKVGSL